MGKRAGKAEIFEITVEKLVYGGSGFAHHEGKVVFVPFSVAGDRLLVRPVEEKKSFIRAEIVKVLKAGKGRVAPFCSHFTRCGGCHWQQLEYGRQAEAKRLILEEALHHRFPETRQISIRLQPCPQPTGYRSRGRMQLRGSGEKASVGFFRPGSHTVEDVESCPLFRPALNEALRAVRQFKLKVDTDSRPREMDIACSEEEDSWATAHAGEPAPEQGVTPLFGRRPGEEVLLRRRVGEFTYSVTASSFFQANDFMISELVSSVQRAAGTAGTGSALDLFAGVGLFSLPLARQFEKVWAVENSGPATKLCARNAVTAGIRNLEIVCADVAAWLQSGGSPEPESCDLILLDPPRTGAGGDVMKQILRLRPETIIYVSCDPQTLVRDLAVIAPGAYAIKSAEGLDLFPQTYHFETVVQLQLNQR